MINTAKTSLIFHLKETHLFYIKINKSNSTGTFFVVPQFASFLPLHKIGTGTFLSFQICIKISAESVSNETNQDPIKCISFSQQNGTLPVFNFNGCCGVGRWCGHFF